MLMDRSWEWCEAAHAAAGITFVRVHIETSQPRAARGGGLDKPRGNGCHLFMSQKFGTGEIVVALGVVSSFEVVGMKAHTAEERSSSRLDLLRLLLIILCLWTKHRKLVTTLLVARIGLCSCAGAAHH